MIAGAIIASRPQGYVVYPGYAQPVYGSGCYWASQPSTTAPRRRLYGAAGSGLPRLRPATGAGLCWTAGAAARYC